MYMVSNKHITAILLPMDVKGMEGFIQSPDKGTIMNGKFHNSHFGAVGYFGLLFVLLSSQSVFV